MNIFVTDPSPLRSAQNLDNKRMVKMILESAQMLSTNARLMGVESDMLYKSTHHNHPCTKWARESEGNFNWLLEHAYALANIYTTKYHKIHKSVEVLDFIAKQKFIFKKKKLTKFVMAMPDEFRSKNVFKSYKRYLKWKLNNTKSYV